MDDIEFLIKQTFKWDVVQKKEDVTGGLVNKASLYETEFGNIFVKHSKRDNAYDMFQAEEAGLHLIKETDCIKTPMPQKVLRNPTGGAIFIMEYFDGLKPMQSWEKLGFQMAKLHLDNLNHLKKSQLSEGFVGKNTFKPVLKFGFDYATFFGPDYSVSSVWTDTWQEYFIRHLMQPLFEQTGKDDKEMRELWSELQLVLHHIFDEFNVKPSLVHGDFCDINIGQLDDEPVLYDPCCLYAPAEFDFTIPMMENNFPPSFFEAYHSIIPKQKGFDRLIKPHLLFGYLLCYSCSQQNRQTVIDIGQELLRTAKP